MELQARSCSFCYGPITALRYSCLAPNLPGLSRGVRQWKLLHLTITRPPRPCDGDLVWSPEAARWLAGELQPWHCRWFRNPVLRALNRNEVRAVRADPFEVLETPQSLDGSAFAAPPRQATLPSNSSASK